MRSNGMSPPTLSAASFRNTPFPSASLSSKRCSAPASASSTRRRCANATPLKPEDMEGAMATKLTSMAGQIGQELGVSAWQTVDQERIKEFAQCTGDRQWIHVDVERAQRESPFRGTIAHGFLTLATLAPAAFEIWIEPAGIGQAFNYGIDRLRFINPVKAGARIRSRIKLLAIEPKGEGRLLVTTENTVEIEGEDRPALIATMLAMVTASAEDTKPREQPPC